MSKILGVDIGSDSIKLALVNSGRIEKVCSVESPPNLLQDGRVVSTEAVGTLLRGAVRRNGIRASRAAVCMPYESTYVRNVTVPLMNEEQLRYNLPYEFDDYITDDPKNYVFDYAMLSAPGEIVPIPDPDGGEETRDGMELMAVATPVAMLREAREFLRPSGMKLAQAAPAVSAYVAVIRRYERSTGRQGEYCMLDLGQQSVRMHMFRSDRHIITRVLESGLSGLGEAVSAHYDVDIVQAREYFITDHEGCQELPECQALYGNIAVGLMRALNFYRFSNPDSQLGDIWLCGGGAAIAPLRSALEGTLDMRLHPVQELFSSGGGDMNNFVHAAGIAMAWGGR